MPRRRCPDDEVHAFINELARPVHTYLYGRRMYETMLYWETAHPDQSQPAVVRDFTEIWQAAEKIVYSRTLDSVSSAQTRIERHFDAEAVRHVRTTSARDLTVAGANLAAQAIKAGLVDELHRFVVGVVLGRASRGYLRTFASISSCPTPADSPRARPTFSIAPRSWSRHRPARITCRPRSYRRDA
jgi:dihydrofolate reductase